MFSRFLAFILSLSAFFYSLTLGAQTPQTFSYTTPICKNAPATNPKFSPNWQGGTGIFISQPGLSINFSSGQINAGGSQVGTYTVSYVGGLCGCTPTTVVQVVNATPLSVTGNTACLNLGSSTTLSSVPSTFATYTWSFNGQTSPTTIISAGSPGPHTLSATDPNGCKSFVVFTVTFYQPFNPVISASPIVCLGSTVTLIASGATSYTWNTGATTSVLAVSPSVSTVYTVSSRDVRGCIGKKTHSLTVLPGPGFSVDHYTVCAGLEANLAVNNVTPANVSFIWMPGSLKGSSVSVSPSASGVYSVTGNNGGCTSTKTVSVTVLKTFSPSTVFSYSLPLCAGQANDVLPDTTENFTWGGKFFTTPGEGYSTDLPLDESSGRVFVKLAKAGTYLVTYAIPATSLAAEGCTAAVSNTAIVSLIDSTSLEISPDVTITEGESVLLNVSGGDIFEWDPPTGLSCTNCPETMAYPAETTTYCVRGLANGCYSTKCVKVDVVCHNNNDFSVPSAFTPNADGLNDELCLKGWDRCNSEFQIRVFNRWGEQVFTSADPEFCWDGTYNGAALDADVYAYFIKARFFGEAEFVKSGNITVLK